MTRQATTYSLNGCSCEVATDRAILVEIPDFDEPVWVPQSVSHDDSEVYKRGTDGVLVVEFWWAEKKRWI